MPRSKKAQRVEWADCILRIEDWRPYYGLLLKGSSRAPERYLEHLHLTLQCRMLIPDT